VAFFAGSIGLAASTSDSSTPTSASSQTEQTTLADRMAFRRATYPVNLSAIQQKLLAGKCKTAQANLKNIQAKNLAANKERQDTYTSLTSRLNTMIDNLKNQGLDNSELKVAAGKFNSAVSQYTSDASSYNTTLEDISTMDCSADSPGFETTLLSARALRTQLSKDAASIKITGASVTEKLSAIKETLSTEEGTN
jgi:hypothetical protein